MRVYKIRVGAPPFKVSVIVPARRKENAKEILHDLKNQSFNNYEILVVAGKGRIAKAWNVGIKNASGEILLFTESDCRVPNEWIRKNGKNS
jgi:glycosyltransferase involved in cell wall biosynthesis